ncbi:8-amino-7-oxononanoate synthase [compost metagenome]
MGTLSKSIGTEGGYVAASANVIQYLRNYARPFIFQTSLSPGVIGAALKAVEIIQTEPVYRQRVMANAEYMRTGLRKLGYRLIEGTTPILAVVTGEAKRAVEVSRCLEGHGVFAPAIRPPTVPEGTSRIRVTLSAVHTRDEMDRALAAFAAASNEI